MVTWSRFWLRPIVCKGCESMLITKAPLCLCIAFVIAVLVVTGCTRKESPKPETHGYISVVKAERRRLKTEIKLPGNFEAYQDVPIHAKVEGYIQWIGVDRGSIVKKGQKMITVFAPEVEAKVKEALAKVSSVEATYRQAQQTLDSTMSRLVEARAKLSADEFINTRLKEASDQYAPAVAKNDIDVTNQTVEADKARVKAVTAEVEGAKNLVASEIGNLDAAKNLYEALKTMHSYLEISAPFDGVISERNVHVGSIVSVSAGRTGMVKPLLRIQELDLLRLVVAVPEAAVAGVKIGDKIPFTVPAFPSRSFEGRVARPAYALEPKTRTMPVELNYWNSTNYELNPGMFATVFWPVTRPFDTIFVPESAMKTNLKGSFVVKIVNGKAEQIEVRAGEPMGYYVEVMGDIKEGDLVALAANDELKSGMSVSVKLATSKEIESASKLLGAGAE
jgi:membrane fusion protein, multidrug efflux system